MTFRAVSAREDERRRTITTTALYSAVCSSRIHHRQRCFTDKLRHISAVVAPMPRVFDGDGFESVAPSLFFYVVSVG